MLPHPHGEAHDVAGAFSEISLGLHGIDDGDIEDDDPRLWLQQIRGAMDTTGLEDPDGRGLHMVKAESMGINERHGFSSAVGELAFWLDMKVHGQDP